MNDLQNSVNEEMEDDDSDLESFGISLDKTGEGGSGYHTKNNPNDRLRGFQRSTISNSDPKSPIDIRCKALEIIHGRLGQDEDAFATLLVYDFWFDATERFRRVASAKITFVFSSSESGAPGPEVYAMTPFSRYSLLPTTQEVSYTRESEVKAEAGQMGVSLGASHKWSKTVNTTENNDIRVIGSTVCDKFGTEVGVNWVLHENNADKTGVPSFLRTAILLKREEDNKFECSVKIAVEADWKTEMTKLFGSREKDDPIFFNPELPPTSKLGKKYDTANLGSIDIEEFFDTTFQTTFTNAVKTARKSSKD